MYWWVLLFLGLLVHNCSGHIPANRAKRVSTLAYNRREEMQFTDRQKGVGPHLDSVVVAVIPASASASTTQTGTSPEGNITLRYDRTKLGYLRSQPREYYARVKRC